MDYFGSVTESVQFVVTCHQNCVNYNNEGSNPVLAHNDTFREVKITGSEVLHAINVTLLVFSTYIESSDISLKKIVVYLTINLSACYPGFVYSRSYKMCICYGRDVSVCVAMVKLNMDIGLEFGKI